MAGKHIGERNRKELENKYSCDPHIEWTSDSVQVYSPDHDFRWAMADAPDQWVRIGLLSDGRLCVDRSDPSTMHKRSLSPLPGIPSFQK